MSQQGEQVEFDSGAGMYLNNLIHFVLRLRHVPNVQGYFDGFLGDARQRTRYPWMEVHYRLELEYKQCMWTQNMLYTKLPKKACEYCRNIKILKDHSVSSRFF